MKVENTFPDNIAGLNTANPETDRRVIKQMSPIAGPSASLTPKLQSRPADSSKIVDTS